MIDYEEIDNILNKVEEVLLSLTSEYKLKQVSIERWRWDEPVITLTWTDSGHISRNINALIILEGPSPCRLLVEGNAWQDTDEAEGKIRVRHWQHTEIDSVWLPQTLEAIDEAYSKVSKWSTDDLTRREHLTPQSAEL